MCSKIPPHPPKLDFKHELTSLLTLPPSKETIKLKNVCEGGERPVFTPPSKDE